MTDKPRMQFRSKSKLTSVALAAAMTFFSSATVAADEKPISFAVPYAAGSNVDVIARSVGQNITGQTKRTVIVENRTGASGNLAAEYVANSKPDGSTLLLTVNNAVTVNPLLYSKLSFDPMALKPVAVVYLGGGYVLVANPKSGFTSVADVIEKAKAKPNSIDYASYGQGSMPHMCGELLQDATGIKLVHVPYGKTTPVTDLAGGHIGLGFAPIASVAELVREGKLNALAITGPNRIKIMPDVPTMSETVPGYSCAPWVGVFAPEKTPKETVENLSKMIGSAVQTPEFVAQRELEGARVPTENTPEYVTKLVKDDHETWAKIIKTLNIKLD